MAYQFLTTSQNHTVVGFLNCPLFLLEVVSILPSETNRTQGHHGADRTTEREMYCLTYTGILLTNMFPFATISSG